MFTMSLKHPSNRRLRTPLSAAAAIAIAIKRIRTRSSLTVVALTFITIVTNVATSLPSGGGFQRRFPNAIIIGVKKGGTRALLEFLRLNPRIRAPGPEVHYFDRHFDRGPAWYRRQMPETNPGEITLEKTPSYFVTKAAPERVHNFNPKLKLIIVVRDPVQRAISDYTQTASKRVGMDTFEHMAVNGSSGAVNTSWGAIKIGIYHRYVKRWLRYFPLRQLHFVSGENLISNPAQEINAIERFVGLTPPTVTADQFQFNRTKGFPCIRKPSDGSVRCLGKTKGRPHPTISPDLIHKLRSFFHSHNQQFYSMIGRDFGW